MRIQTVAFMLTLGLGGCAPTVPRLAAPPPPEQWGPYALHNGGTEPLTMTFAYPLTPVDCALLDGTEDLVAPALSSIPWGETRELTLAPLELRIPPITLGWQGWPVSGCAAMRVDVAGAGERFLFAPDETDAAGGFPTTATASELGERVVSIVTDSNQVWRPTSPGLLFERTVPFPTCGEDDWKPCPDCLLERVPGGMAFGYDGPGGSLDGHVTEMGTSMVDGRHCTELMIDVPSGRFTSRMCVPEAAPPLPFAVGDAITVEFHEQEDDARLHLEGAGSSATATTSMALPPSLHRAGPRAPVQCTTGSAPCLGLEMDWLAFEDVRSDAALEPIHPGVFNPFTIAGPDEGSTELAIWVDAARTSLTDPERCRPPIDLLTLRTALP